MNKSKAKRIAYTIASSAVLACRKVTSYVVERDDQLRIEEGLLQIAKWLSDHGDPVPKHGESIGGEKGEERVFSALVACQNVLRPLSKPQREAVFRGLHAWYMHEADRQTLGEEDEFELF